MRFVLLSTVKNYNSNVNILTNHHIYVINSFYNILIELFIISSRMYTHNNDPGGKEDDSILSFLYMQLLL